MLFGDIFAVFVLHQNGAQTGQALLAACQAASTGNALAIKEIFQNVGGLLEDHGTKVDAHVHMTDAGYLALLLALVQPYVALPQKRRKLLAGLFVLGGLLGKRAGGFCRGIADCRAHSRRLRRVEISPQRRPRERI
jgi:hypothetical protein